MTKRTIKREDALAYHSSGRKGKIEVIPSKSVSTQYELSLAYSPGVAEPCKDIAENEELVYEYTAKGNLVGVISNGTAVLGLGNIGAAAGKPVFEGKGVLFKKFADIDVFDIEISTQDPDEFINTVVNLEPTFGGINLEDIKAPECFYIEQELQKRMQIPIMHDDQHGTAIISGAALLNALDIQQKKIEEVIVAVSGAGASAIACCRMYAKLGVKKEHIFLCDRKGLIFPGRDADMTETKAEFANGTGPADLAEIMKKADVFLGLSSAGLVSKEMIASMPPNPIVFALANPDPEISYEDASSVRTDIIMATGRSDYPNQVNNVLGFPFIFRGALDVRAKAINDEMKIAAVYALAELAKEPVPESVVRAYGGDPIIYGKEYIIPKPLDNRVLLYVAPAVAKAAIDSGASRIAELDIDQYRIQLESQQTNVRRFIGGIISGLQKSKKKQRIIFTEGDDVKVLRAAEIIVQLGIAHPMLIGESAKIQALVDEYQIDLSGIECIDIQNLNHLDEFADILTAKRQRKGMTKNQANRIVRRRIEYAAMMVETGNADGMISGIKLNYGDTIKPVLEIIGTNPRFSRVAGIQAFISKKGDTIFFADATINISPNAEELADIAIMTAEAVKRLDMEPRIAMLSFSDFGSSNDGSAIKMREAARLAKERNPQLIIDGEMQGDTAVSNEKTEDHFPFSAIQGDANVLVFPDLNAANICYKLMSKLSQSEVVGPILVGMNKPVHILDRSADVNDVVSMAAICADEAIANNRGR
ncbi:MAG: NADP-dependent malic enzyme [Candidatus Kapaibacteriota bacterium]